jgi:hypothetical protein
VDDEQIKLLLKVRELRDEIGKVLLRRPGHDALSDVWRSLCFQHFAVERALRDLGWRSGA